MLFTSQIPCQRLLALLSILCPVIAAILSLIVPSSDGQFWAEINSTTSDDANRYAGALMALSEVFRIFLFVVLGCVIGLVFAIFSLTIQRTKFGFIGLALNLSPFVLFVFMKS